jgi:hypothetical protein
MNEGFIAYTKDNINLFRLLSLRSALKLEIVGMKRRGRSAYSIIKEEFAWFPIHEILRHICNWSLVLLGYISHDVSIAFAKVSGRSIDGVVYSGWIEDFPPTTPANFEEALASTSLSMIGELQFCD